MSPSNPRSESVRQLQRRFAAPVRHLGAFLHARDQVEVVEATEHQLTADVHANELAYRVVLERPGCAVGQRLRCSCRPLSADASCAHVWAALLMFDQLLFEIDAALSTAEAADCEAAAPSEQPAPKRAVSTQRGRGSVSGSWRQRLLSVLPPTGVLPPMAAQTVLEYQLDFFHFDDEAAFVVHVVQRQRKQDGQLGVPRKGRLPALVRERLPRVDRDLITLLTREGGLHSYDFDDYARPRGGDVWLSQPYYVRPLDLPAVLPLLAATGRVFQTPDMLSDEDPIQLQIDLGEPFQFEVLIVERDPATEPRRDVVEVRGSLGRGEERLTLDGGGLLDRGVVLVGDRVLRVDCHGAKDLVKELARGPIEIARDEVPEVLAALATIGGADRFLARMIDAVPPGEPSGVIALQFPKGSSAPLPAELRFDYDGTLVEAANQQPLLPVEGQVRRRDRDAEAALLQRAAAAGIERSPGGMLHCARERLVAVSAALHADGFRVLAQGRPMRAFGSGKGSVRSGIDWLEVGVELSFDGYAAALPELLRRKITLEGFVELDDGSFGMLPQSWLRRLETLRSLHGEVDGDTVKLRSSQALLLDALLAARERDVFAVDREFAAMQKQFAEVALPTALDAPQGFVGELRGYQREGLGWLQFLRQLGLGGCLADDMGLGKTVQVLAMLASLPKQKGKGKNQHRPSLIVAPRSVLGNWLAECKRFVPELRVVDFSGPGRWRGKTARELRTCDLVLTTYALVRADAATFLDKKVRFRYAILDEAQAIKNADSQSAKAVRLLQAEHRLALTGTPVENHLGELWSLFEFLNPGMLGRLTAFQALFGKDATDDDMRQNRELVQRALRPVMLRRTKAQVLKDLPEKIEQTLWCDLEPQQRRRYDQLRDHFRERLLQPGAFDGKQGFVVLEALLRLRQAACHEGLLDAKRRQAASAKFEELLPRLEELAAEGHKALVFSQFTSLLDLLQTQLKQRGLAWERIDGKTKQREQKVERFQNDPGCALFLVSLKAGGVGLNLTAASYVFLLDPWWNPAAEMQAVDRAHRIGQKRAVHAYRLVCRDTVEERVLELQGKKKALCEAILGNERSLLQDLTREDLEALLR